MWLPGYLDGSTIYYFYFIGIIVALPFGISYVRDKNSGYIKNICNRVEKKKYLKAKFISTFISGGCTAVIPLIIDFLIVRLIIPIDCFEDIKGTVLNGITDWNKLKTSMRDALGDFIWKRTKRRPMILPIIEEV